MVEERRNEQDRCENIDMKLIDTMAGAGQRTHCFNKASTAVVFSIDPRCAPVCIRDVAILF